MMQTSHRRILGVLLGASMVSVASTDFYVPSLPDLPEWFGTSESLIKLTVSLNILAFGLAQFVYGPLADRFGRRPVLLWAMSLFALASLACAGAQTIEALLTARVAQGLLAAAEAVVVLAVIRDVFNPEERVKAFALFGMVIAVAPALAPIAGGYLHVWFGWQSNFLAMSALAAAVALLIFRFLPESGIPDPRALQPRRIVAAYGVLLGNRVFMSYALMSGACMGVVFAFVTAAPFLLVDVFGIGIERYAYFQAAQVLAFFLGSWVAGKMVSVVGEERLLWGSLLCAAAGAAATVGLAVSSWLGPVSLNLAVALIFFAVGPIFAVAPARAMAVFEHGGGIAAAVLAAMEMLMASLGSVMVVVLGRGSALPLAVTLAAMAALQWLLYLLARDGTAPAA